MTPSDTADLGVVALALYVEVGGALCFESYAGQTRTVMLGNNSILPVGSTRVNATGTTASGIHAFTAG